MRDHLIFSGPRLAISKSPIRTDEGRYKNGVAQLSRRVRFARVARRLVSLFAGSQVLTF
jgi:hypothetical protein